MGLPLNVNIPAFNISECYNIQTIYKNLDFRTRPNLFGECRRNITANQSAIYRESLISRLPFDVLKEIFKYLSPNELLRKASVCRTWCILLQNDKFLADYLSVHPNSSAIKTKQIELEKSDQYVARIQSLVIKKFNPQEIWSIVSTNDSNNKKLS